MVSSVVWLNAAAEPTLAECVIAFLARDGRLAASTRRVLPKRWVLEKVGGRDPADAILYRRLRRSRPDRVAR